MKKLNLLLIAIGMMATTSANAQDEKYVPPKGYHVVSKTVESSSSEHDNDATNNAVKKKAYKPAVKPKSTAGGQKKKTSAQSSSSASSKSRYRSSKSSEKKVIVIAPDEAQAPKQQQNPVIYNDYRQWHYTYNYGENSPFGMGGNVVIDSVCVDSGSVAENETKDTCGKLRKKWTKTKWRKPLTEFKVYTLEHFQSDEYDPLSTKVDTSWIKRPLHTRTFLVYEKHLKNKCQDTIVRYDTCKKWWVATRRWGGIAILGGGLVALGDYACKNQYWGLLDGNFGQKSSNNNGNSGNNNGNDTSGTGTNYPTHKPGSTSGNKPGNTSQKPDVLPVTQKTQKPVQTFSTTVVRQQEQRFDLNEFLRKLPPTRVGVNISLDFKHFEPYVTFCGIKALL